MVELLNTANGPSDSIRRLEGGGGLFCSWRISTSWKTLLKEMLVRSTYWLYSGDKYVDYRRFITEEKQKNNKKQCSIVAKRNGKTLNQVEIRSGQAVKTCQQSLFAPRVPTDRCTCTHFFFPQQNLRFQFQFRPSLHISLLILKVWFWSHLFVHSCRLSGS
jgi:hypothetical protein